MLLTAATTVVITGASAGVGRATAIAFARRGCRVALIARGRAGLQAARADCEQAGAAEVMTIRLDASSAEAVQTAAGRIEEQLGPIDVWVNALMTSVFGRVHEVQAEEFRRVMEVNYLGYVHGTLAALERMRGRDRGLIVQVGSALAFRGIPLQAAYCASKHAIQGFTESLRTELLADGSGVVVTQVHLPAVNTPQFGWVRSRLPRHPRPVPPVFQPEVAADAVLWAAEHEPRAMVVGATSVAMRVANTVAGGLLDRFLARSAIEDQQTDEVVDPAHRTDNLDAPQDDEVDHGVRGVFDEEAIDRSAQLWLRTHPGALAGVGAVLAVGLTRRRRG